MYSLSDLIHLCWKKAVFSVFHSVFHSVLEIDVRVYWKSVHNLVWEIGVEIGVRVYWKSVYNLVLEIGVRVYWKSVYVCIGNQCTTFRVGNWCTILCMNWTVVSHSRVQFRFSFWRIFGWIVLYVGVS